MFSYSQPIELRVQELIAGVRSDIAAKMFAGGGDLEEMKDVADRVATVMRGVDGLEEVKVEQTIGLPTLRIVPDREAIARLGIDVQDVLDVVEAIGGRPLGIGVRGTEALRRPGAVRSLGAG